MKTNKILWSNSIKKINRILLRHKTSKIFLFTGKGSYAASGAQTLIQSLNQSMYRYSDFDANPNLRDIKKCLPLFKKFAPNLVIAIGGGSVIDFAKTVNGLSGQVNIPEDFIVGGKPLQVTGKPLIAIPTTSGTGSEATHFAVVYVGKTKYSLSHPSLKPTYSIIDPKLTYSLDPHTTAVTGMDALSQAIESYWSNAATPESQLYAKKAISLINQYLLKAFAGSKIAKNNMAKAAHLAGKAINISKTTACHAISYPLTAYFSIPHGHAVALTLPEMLQHNYQVTQKDCLHPRGPRHAQKQIQEIIRLLGSKNVKEAKKYLEEMMDSMSLSRSLSSLGIKNQKDIKTIITNGFNPQRVANNPRNLSKKNLLTILKHIA